MAISKTVGWIVTAVLLIAAAVFFGYALALS
jgi:hypothetical protein